MQLLPHVQPLPRDSALCLGAFDGVHLGHQALFARARSLAAHVAVLTFDPHPRAILTPRVPQELLQSAAQRERTCRALGVDFLAVVRFDTALANLSPLEFARQFIVRGLAPRVAVVGRDFRFGVDRSGTIDELRALLAPAQIDLSVVDDVELISEASGAAARISSSAIRGAVVAGEFAWAARMLGRAYAVEGRVVHGDGRGRQIGIPTANLAIHEALLPAPGVYACALVDCDASSPERGTLWPAVANIGVSPTFAVAPLTPRVEVHAFGVDLGSRLYGRTVEVAWLARIRDERRFESVAALVAQIQADIAAAQAIVNPDALATVLAPCFPEATGAMEAG